MISNLIRLHTNTINENAVNEVNQTINNFFRVGDGQQVYPNILWIDGKTFFVGDKSNAFNNQIQAYQYDHNFKEFFLIDVGNGTDTFDAFNHPVPYLWLENDYVYCGQTNTHNDPVDVFKSNLKNSIKQGFTELSQINGVVAYPQFFMNKNNRVCIGNRSFRGNGEFNLAVLISDGGIEGSFNETIITDEPSANTYRIYNNFPICYGTQTKHVVVGSRRNDAPSPEVYFAHMLLVTDDFTTYRNAENTFNRDVTVSRLTDTEIDNNFTINGSLSNDTLDLGQMNGIMIDDIYFGVAVKSGTSDLYIFRWENDIVTEHLLNIPNIIRNFFNPFLFYNGKDLIISCLTDDNTTVKKEIYAAPLDVSSFEKKYEFTENVSLTDKPILLPQNFDKVTGEYLVFVTASGNEASFIEMRDKFFI